jgi:hypothetical protein
MTYNVGSYTQGRIAGGLAIADLRFLSSRKKTKRKDSHRKPLLLRLTVAEVSKRYYTNAYFVMSL